LPGKPQRFYYTPLRRGVNQVGVSQRENITQNIARHKGETDA